MPLFDGIFSSGEPASLFEPEVLCPRRVCSEGKINEVLALQRRDGGWAHIAAETGSGPAAVILAPGRMADRVTATARTLVREDAVQPELLIPE